MAFYGGISKPKTNTNQGGGDFQQRPFDRLVTVTGYDLNKSRLYAEDDKGKKFEVFVNAEMIRASEERLKTKAMSASERSKSWMGHLIDAQMQKHYGEGSKIILKGSKTVQKDNGKGYTVCEVQRIVGVPNPDPDKTFHGLFSATAWRDADGMLRCSRVQHWQENAIDINDSEALENLQSKMDEILKESGKQVGSHTVTLPTIGFQFRTIVKTDKKAYDGKDVWQVVDQSIPFDWIPGPLDENGREIKEQAHTVTGDELLEFVSAYVKYISEEKTEFQNHIESGNIRIEVCPYKTYPASNNSHLQLTFGDPKRDANVRFNPLYQMTHRRNYMDLEQTDMQQGKNWIVSGIIQISPNKIEKVNGQPTEIPSYWVNNLHTYGISGNVHSFIRSANGDKVEPHEKLKVQVDKDAPAPQQATPHNEAAAPKAKAAAPQTQQDYDPGFDDNYDPFASHTPPSETAGGDNFFDDVPDFDTPAPAAKKPSFPKFGGGNKAPF